MEALGKLPGGQDARKALSWLDENRDQFQGRIYSPMMLNITLKKPEDAVFLETLIPLKDLVAFGAEDVDDANSFLKQVCLWCLDNVHILYDLYSSSL